MFYDWSASGGIMELGRKAGIFNFKGSTCFRFTSEFARIDVPYTVTDRLVDPSNFKGSTFDGAHFHISGTIVECIDVAEFNNQESEEQMARGLFQAYIVDLRTDEVWQTDRPFVARDEMGARMKVLIQARDFITSDDDIDMYHISVGQLASIPGRIVPEERPPLLTNGES